MVWGRTLSTIPTTMHPQIPSHHGSFVSFPVGETRAVSPVGGTEADCASLALTKEVQYQAQEPSGSQKSCDMCMIDDSMKEPTRQGKWRPGPNGKGSLCDA
jgi:hypothetical protein